MEFEAPVNLKTQARDNYGYSYPVSIVVEDRDGFLVGERILKIHDTPGSWYLRTLLASSVGARLAIDYGQDWYCENIQSLIEEANHE